jgi:hypothetical protein
MRIFSGSTKVAFGFGLGVVAAGLVKEILPAFHGLGRPLLKASVKSGMILASSGRVKLAEFKETLADVAAEAEAELRTEQPEFASKRPFEEGPKQNAGIM